MREASEQSMTVFEAETDLGPVRISAGHLAEHGYLDVAIGETFVRASLTAKQAGEGGHTLLDLRANLNVLEGDRQRRERDGDAA